MDTLETHDSRVAILCDGEQVGIATLRVYVAPHRTIVEEVLIDARARIGLPDPSEHLYELQFLDMFDAVAWEAAKHPERFGKDM